MTAGFASHVRAGKDDAMDAPTPIDQTRVNKP